MNQGKEKESSGILFKIQKIEMNKNNNYFNFFASNIIIEQTYSDGYCLGYLSGNKYLFG